MFFMKKVNFKKKSADDHYLRHILLDDVRPFGIATLEFETKLKKSIRMGITIFKISFGEVCRLIYSRKFNFMAHALP